MGRVGWVSMFMLAIPAPPLSRPRNDMLTAHVACPSIRRPQSNKRHSGGTANNPREMPFVLFPERRFDESFPVELTRQEREERRKEGKGTEQTEDRGEGSEYRH